MTGPGVAALLPIRLETRFLPPGHLPERPAEPDPSGPPTWRLRLRIVPDTISVDRHEPAPSQAEKLGLAAFWRSLHTVPDPADPLASARRAATEPGYADAFSRLAAQVGAGRAAWLVRAVPVGGDGDGVRVGDIDAGATSRDGAGVVRAFPGAVDVWVRWHDEPAVEVLATLEPDIAALEAPPAQVPPPWLVEWEPGVAAGMAAEIVLPRHPRHIEVLGVSGLREDEPGDGDGGLVALLRGHAAGGALSLTGPGQATSIVHGAPVLATGADARDWFQAPGEPPPLARRTLDALLGGGVAGLGPVRATGDDRLDAELVRVTFPALWGYGLAGVLGLTDPLELAELWRWATRWLRPQGSFATLVVGGTAYGVLPVVDAGAVAAAAGDNLQAVRPLLGPLASAVSAWAGAAEADVGVVGGGVADAVRLLRRGPVPGHVGRVSYMATDLFAVMGGEDPSTRRDEWDDHHGPALRVLAGTPDDGAPPQPPRFGGRRYWARDARGRSLALPLIVGDQPSPDDAADALTTVMGQWREDLLFEDVDFGTGPLRCLYAHRELPSSGFYVDRRHPDSLLARLLTRSLAVAGAVLDLWRQRIGPGLDPVWGPEPHGELVEALVLHGDSTRARHHLDALAHVLRDHGGDGTWAQQERLAAELVDELTWLAHDGMDLVVGLAWEAIGDPDRDRPAHRALRALLETAGGRWDAWWDGVGAAHLADVQAAAPAPPAAGVYGWVDAPWRGAPGPGPGGLLMAPSLAQAATAAALRDRAVHDVEPRWQLSRDSATIGPARALLTEIAEGWHPAEVVGRMIERSVVDAGSVAGTLLGAADLVALRQRFPLRVGQGHFGCCHGLDVLAAAPADLPELDRAPGALPEALGTVRAVLGTAADLLLAESVHGVLAGRPERAAVATEALAGQLAPGRLDVLEGDHPGRAVHSLVLAALPAAAPPVGASGILAAAPAFDAAVRAAAPGAPWSVRLDGPNGPVVVPLEALGLAPVHAAVLDDAALIRLAVLHAGTSGHVVGPSSSAAAAPPGAALARQLAAALGGRAPDPAELTPPSARSADGTEPSDVTSTRDAAVEGWRARIGELAAAAEHLAGSITGDAERAGAAWGVALARQRALAAGEEPPDELPDPGPDRSRLAHHVLALAAWGIAPDAEVADLATADPARQAGALAATLAHLCRGASTLGARAAAARRALAAVDPPGSPDGGRPGPGVLAELAAGRPLPIGTPADPALLGGTLAPAAGTATVTDWLPTVAAVRPALAPLLRLLEVPGVWLGAVEPDDPWRLGALAPPPPDAPPAVGLAADPRLTVVVGTAPAASGTSELVVVDSFAERVPDPHQDLGLAFDAATPSAAPPQAVLVVPSADPVVGLIPGDLPAAVLLSRAMAHARMATTATLADARLGPLAAACMLPQDGDTGCPLADPHTLPRLDLPAGLVPLPTHEDTADVVGAVTADAAWMVGVQWRLGEHLGEDAATPVLVEADVAEELIGEPSLARRPAEAVTEAGGWRADELLHTARWPVPGGEAVVARHDAGPLGWWSLGRDPGVGAVAPGGDTAVQRGIPSRLRWPGQPRRRFWEVDDAPLDPVGKGPDRAHPASLHLVDVVSRLGDDWYRVPVTGRSGTFLRTVGATMTDSAGGVWPLETDPGWALYAVAGADPDPTAVPSPGAFHRALPVLLTAGAALEGEAFEQVALAIDEDENLLWAAVLRGRGVAAEPPEPADAVTVTATPRILGTAEMEVEWSLGGAPPRDRVPYLYGAVVQPGRFGHGHDLFVQARIKDPRTGELTPVPSVALLASGDEAGYDAGRRPHTLRPLAVPASGVRLLRRPVLARDTHGRPVTWDRTERRPLDVTVDVDMLWDVLVPLPGGRTDTGAAPA